jgi:hypothetical protein
VARKKINRTFFKVFLLLLSTLASCALCWLSLWVSCFSLSHSSTQFCKDVEEFAKRNDPDGEDVLKFDFPSRELGFMGVPFKSNVLLQPTAQDCLVHLVSADLLFGLKLKSFELSRTGGRPAILCVGPGGCGGGVLRARHVRPAPV